MTSSSNISYDGQVLTLSLPDATPPVLSRLDLGKSASFQFSVEDNALLYRANPADPNSVVARFADKVEAGDCLARISKILSGTSARKTVDNESLTMGQAFKLLLRWSMITLGILLVLLMLYACVKAKINNVTTIALQETIKEQSAAAIVPPVKEIPPAVPVVAEDYLPDPVNTTPSAVK